MSGTGIGSPHAGAGASAAAAASSDSSHTVRVSTTAEDVHVIPLSERYADEQEHLDRQFAQATDLLKITSPEQRQKVLLAIEILEKIAASGHLPAIDRLIGIYLMGVQGKYSDEKILEIDFGKVLHYAEQLQSDEGWQLICEFYLGVRTEDNTTKTEDINLVKASQAYKKSTTPLQHNDFPSTDQGRCFGRYHHLYLQNPETYITLITDDPDASANDIRAIILGLTQCEKGQMDEAKRFTHLADMISGHPDYLNEIMSQMPLEDKLAFAEHLLQPETLQIRALVLAEILKDKDISNTTKIEIEFDQNFEAMTAKLNALSAGTSLKDLCSTMSGFREYQLLYKRFQPKFLDLLRQATLLDHQGVEGADALQTAFSQRATCKSTEYQEMKALPKT